jgi:uncharacterized damage-inducible protein DinB
MKKLDNTMRVVETALSNLAEDQMSEDFPILIWEQPTKMEYAMIHLITHLNYHLGQVNYHRRLLDSK